MIYKMLKKNVVLMSVLLMSFAAEGLAAKVFLGVRVMASAIIQIVLQQAWGHKKCSWQSGVYMR